MLTQLNYSASPTIYDQYGHALIGGANALVRGEGGELQPTVFPLPTRPTSELTPQARRQAIFATYTGMIQPAVDLYRQCVTEDGWISGILRTMADGILGLPHAFVGGSPEMRSALLDADGTPSEYTRMHPHAECAQIFADGIGFCPGLGQYVFPRNDARRPIGSNRVPRLEWRDPRWLWRNPVTMQWYFTDRAGMHEIHPGDGEWFMFSPYPDVDMWRHGPWLYMTLAAIFARDAVFDRQRVSEVTTPTPVLRAQKPSSEKARREAEKQVRSLAHDNRIVLPDQWIYEIVSASSEYNDVAAAIVEWACGMVEVGLTGNLMGLKAQSAFTDAGIYKRTTTDRRRFFANAWAHDIREQGLTWWGLDNYGTSNVPVLSINVESPEDIRAHAKALQEWGSGLVSLVDGLDKVGQQVDPAWVHETMQRAGIRVLPKAAPPSAAPATPTPVPPQRQRKRRAA